MVCLMESAPSADGVCHSDSAVFTVVLSNFAHADGLSVVGANDSSER